MLERGHTPRSKVFTVFSRTSSLVDFTLVSHFAHQLISAREKLTLLSFFRVPAQFLKDLKHPNHINHPIQSEREVRSKYQNAFAFLT